MGLGSKMGLGGCWIRLVNVGWDKIVLGLSITKGPIGFVCISHKDQFCTYAEI